MFTGIVTDIGEITSLSPGGQADDRRFVVRTKHDMAPIAIGASIACSGCCLTVLEKGKDWFAVEVSGESLDKTHLGEWKQGSRLNLLAGDTVAPRLDEVVPAIDDEYVAVLIHRGQVPGAQPVPGEFRGRALGILVVARGDVRAGRVDLALLARQDGITVLV